MKKNGENNDKCLQKSGADMKADCGISTDPFGSWTGVPEEKGEEPVQDADDL